MAASMSVAEFDREVAGAAVPAVVEFSVPWCGNCRRVAPLVVGLALEFKASVGFVEVDAETSPELVARFAVSSTPTFVVLVEGAEVARMVGGQPPDLLRDLFETVASRPAAPLSSRWVPAGACTLPTAEQSGRLAEFDGLFASTRSVVRRSTSWLRVELDGGEQVEGVARDLTERESRCCDFFEFSVTREGGRVDLDVWVPEERSRVLDGLAEQARQAVGAGGVTG